MSYSNCVYLHCYCSSFIHYFNIISTPTYTMGVFQLPFKLCDELDAMCVKFWWGQVGDERKIHWQRWEKLTRSKKDGGIGFRDLRALNLAMLAK